MDGVILLSDRKGEPKLIPHIKEFFEYTRKHFDCFWLSTHSRYCADDVKKYLAPYFEKDSLDLELISHFKSVPWRTLKTENIVFSSPFIWIDDAPLPSEIKVLRKKGVEKCLLIVGKGTDFLIKLRNRIERLYGSYYKGTF